MKTKTTRTKVTLPSATVTAFEDQLRGTLIQRGDEAYEDARALYNGMIDKHPALIARCVDAADVIASVNFARDNDLLLAIRGGGHNGPGLGSCDDGLVIDLSAMNSVRVNPENKTVRVEGGAVWGDVDHATHAFGLAVPSGIISTTGVGGLTLGGGHGYLTRKYGLTIDNLLAADVVLADGSFVTASDDEHGDLFWALRGGGGNFGVVTSFLFRAHPVHTVHAGPMFWSIDDAAATMRFYRDYMEHAPEDMYGFFTFNTVPPAEPFPPKLHGDTVCGILWCYTGPSDKADEAFDPIRAFRKKPVLDMVGPVPYPALQTLFDPLYPSGLQWYWKGDFVRELPDEAIEQHVKYGSRLPSPLSGMHLYPIDGAVHDVAKHATAWSYRDVRWSSVMVGVDPDPKKAKALKKWTRDYWNALHPYSAGGAYVNFMMEEGKDRVEATYGANYAQLRTIKGKYDPDNLFRVNQNIAPAS